jgi:cation transport ATPase
MRAGERSADAVTSAAPLHDRERSADATPSDRECGADAAPSDRECGADAAPSTTAGLRERVTGTADGAMPYEPSAPCATCARGVDPLRAACVAVTESSVRYFCSRACHEHYLRAEVAQEHAPTSVRGATAATAVPVGLPPPRRVSLEPVARRIAPTQASTPRWPVVSAALCSVVALLPLVGVSVPGATEAAAFGLLGSAIVFASRTPDTRSSGGLLLWLTTPAGIGLLGLAAVLGQGDAARAGAWLDASTASALWLCAAGCGVLLMWLREHLLERSSAAHLALRNELAARLSQRVPVRVPSAPSTASVRTRSGSPHAASLRSVQSPERATPSAWRSVERTLDSLREGDELRCQAGMVVPVDGVVVEGAADVLPYPGAQLPLARSAGAALLAGALVVEGALWVRATQVGERRALFSVFERDLSRRADAGALAITERARSVYVALLAIASLLLLSLLGPEAPAAKLAGIGAALLALPALALARGTRAAFRAAHIAAASRGVRFRDHATLERAAQVDTAVLRVEGILVPRSYTLVEVVSISDSHDEGALVALALAAAGDPTPLGTLAGPARQPGEPHAIARAVRAYAEPRGIAPAVLRRLSVARGLGVSALTDGQGAFVFGSRAALLAAGVSVAVADREAQRAESSGQRVVFLSLGGRVRGLFVFAQSVRNEARPALQQLFDLGLELELVSGDHRASVESLARTLDVTLFKAELSAEQRAAEVRRLRDGEARVVAIGAAPNDELMLTSAELSLGLDAAGQPLHHEAGQPVTYDVTTASWDLRDAACALELARSARLQLRRVFAASALGGAAAVLGALGVAPPWAVVLVALAVDLRSLRPANLAPRTRRRAADTREDA